MAPEAFGNDAVKDWLFISFSGELYLEIYSQVCKSDQYLKKLSCSRQVKSS